MQRLAKVKEEIQRRATSINTQVTERTAIDKAWVVSKLVENHDRASEAGNFAGANKALELIGRTLGAFIDRKEIGKPGDFDHLTDAELDEQINATLAELGVKRIKGASTKH